MDKALIDRRLAQMEAEGVIFRPNMEVGRGVSVERLMDDYHVLVLAAGAEQPRDLDVPGRQLGGVHFAMDYLVQQNRRNAGLPHAGAPILAAGKHVIVIGGGDTGSDCIGTANRQGAASVTQLEILAEPPAAEDKGLSWPRWPLRLRTSSSQEEGSAREFSVKTLRLEGASGQVVSLHAERDGAPLSLKADLVLLAMGFTGVEREGVMASAGATAVRGGYETSRRGVFACGDARRGQSLVVWAIREGRECAALVDAHLRSG
jgi:glutamate synthase (NADPH/NADH) small chain